MDDHRPEEWERSLPPDTRTIEELCAPLSATIPPRAAKWTLGCSSPKTEQQIRGVAKIRATKQHNARIRRHT